MDLNRSGRKRSRCNVKSLEIPGLLIKRKTLEENGQVNKRRKLEMNPLEMEGILENVLSFLDIATIKKVRQVNPLWSREGAKILLTKCYVQIPWTLFADESSDIMDKFKAFLSHKSKDVSMIPNITIDDFEDVEVWKSLGVLGQKVKSLKLILRNHKSESLRNLLDLLPNLQYLMLNIQDSSHHLKFTLINIVTLVRSTKVIGHPLTISSLILRTDNLKELENLEKFSNCNSVMLEELQIIFRPSFSKTVPNFETRIAKIINNLLINSKNCLKKLTLFNCELFLHLLDFPCMTSLSCIKLNFCPKTPNRFNNCKFSSSFRFSEKVPKLEHILIDYAEDSVEWTGSNFFLHVLEKAGVATSVKRVEYTDGVEDFLIEPLFQIFPNVQEFRMHPYACSQQVFQSLWIHGKDLKKLDITINLYDSFENFPNLDSIFTGFSSRTVETLGSVSYTKEQLKKLRVKPSIANLKELEELTIRFYGSSPRGLEKRTLVIAGQYALNLLPKIDRIIIDVQECCHSAECITAAFDHISKFPHVIIITK